MTLRGILIGSAALKLSSSLPPLGLLGAQQADAALHADLAQMHVDRSRDAELILLGYRYHRFDHPLLMNSMDRCIDVVRQILANR